MINSLKKILKSPGLLDTLRLYNYKAYFMLLMHDFNGKNLLGQFFFIFNIMLIKSTNS